MIVVHRLPVLLLLLSSLLDGANAKQVLFESPETDNVTTWQDAKDFCEAKDGKLITKANLCKFFQTNPLPSGQLPEWSPAILTLDYLDEQWIHVSDTDSDGFCETYDAQIECPEKLTDVPTVAPTESPTNGHLDLYTCGDEPGSTITVHSDGVNTPVKLSKNIPDTDSVCVLRRKSDGVQLGRLYSPTNKWERSAVSRSSTAPKISFDCDSEEDVCLVAIPDDGQAYQLVTYKAPKVLNSKEEASRFLAQTTFGPRLEEIEALAGGSFKEWVLQQMDEQVTPPTLHREYFRRRANQRMRTVNPFTRPRRPCETKSRWHRFAFTEEDEGTVFLIDTNYLVTQKEGGAKVTQVDPEWLEPLDATTKQEFVICTVEEQVNGAIEVDSAAGNCNDDKIFQVVTNPPIQLESSAILQQEVLVDNLHLSPLEPPIEGVRLAMLPPTSSCSEPDINGTANLLFLKDPATGGYYRHDGRMLLFENTLKTVASADSMVVLSEDSRCPNVEVTFLNRDSCYVTAEPVCGSTNPLSLVCGSPGEVANDPSVGARFEFTEPKFGVEQGKKRTEDGIMKQHQTSKSTWVMASLFGEDQLRQRVAFALYGILVLGAPNRHHESRSTYYDIFVRNAFGNYRDILKEVSHHGLMGDYLTFRGSRSLVSSGTLPDENYARELLQLFTIGLNQLEKDGEVIIDPSTGEPAPTYDIEDIMSIARVWTGFQEHKYRGNIEAFDPGHRFRNNIDPMLIDMRWHDIFPKTDVMGGYIGDRYPRCIELPQRDFLRTGSAFDFIGSSEEPGLVLDPGSQLYKAMCNPEKSDGPCRFAARVVLDTNLGCHGDECDLDSIDIVRVGNAVYRHSPRPCVSLQFYNDGRTAVRMFKDWGRWKEACVDPRERFSVGEVCCNLSSNSPEYHCPTDMEYLPFAASKKQCQDKGLGMCDGGFHKYWACKTGCCPETVRHGWSGSECSLKVQVDHDGHIAPLHEVVGNPLDPLDKAKATTWFDAYWEDSSQIPDAGTNDCGSCTAVGAVCVCEMSVMEEAAFLSMPSRNDVLSQLKVGSAPPEVFDEGTYVEDQSSEDGMLRMYRRSDSPTALDVDTIFEVEDEIGVTVYLKNIISTVTLGNGEASFRNPPSFFSAIHGGIAGADEERAHFEVDALLDHLLAHPNIAPFIAFRFIQRLVTSNPSPGYIATVAEAFRSGTFEGIGSGKNGDLAATVAAVLLHQEARTVALDADPSQGKLREPLLKIMYALRSLEVKTDEPEQQIMLRNSLQSMIGQMSHEAESIFSWFLPSHSSLGTRANAMGLVTPESEIMTSPNIISYVNAMMSLSRYGVSVKAWGLGDTVEPTGEMTFESSSPAEVTPYSLPKGLDLLRIEKGYNKGDPFKVPKGVTLTLQNGEGNKCVDRYHSDGRPWNIFCTLEPTTLDKTGSSGANLRITGSGGSFEAKVVRWAWAGNLFIFNPTNWDIAEINAALRPGDAITVEHSHTERKCVQQYHNGEPHRVKCKLELTRDFVAEPYGKKSFNFTGAGGSLHARVLHWAYQGTSLFIDPRPADIDKVNDVFPPGSPISLSVIAKDPTDELDLLLTNGRLSDETKATMKQAYNGAFGSEDQSLHYAYQLFFLAAEYQISNVPNGLPIPPPEPKELPKDEELKKPKTIVYLQLNGGADSYNLLVPHSECTGADLWEGYNASRDDLAIPRDSLHVIDVPDGSQPCKKFGMHPSLEFLSTLYKDGDLLWAANTGSLVEPVNRDELKTKKTPNNNFAHNIMTSWAEKVETNNNRALGVLGRISDGLEGRFQSSAFTVRNTSPIQENNPKKSRLPDFISSHSIETLNRGTFIDGGLEDAIHNFTEPCSSIYCHLWSSALRQGIKRTEQLKAVTNTNPLKADTGTYWKNNDRIEQAMKQVARLMAGSEALNADRLTFSVSQHGFDAHFDNGSGLAEPIAAVDRALKSFVAEMKAREKWDEVVVVIGSEFGRALASNGEGGCDHGWGGNYMILGGDVKGGQILGDFLDDFSWESNPLIMRGGRVIPTTPWEAVWNGVAEWFGVPSERMDAVLPLRKNFPGRIFSGQDMFKTPMTSERQLHSQASSAVTRPERKLKTCDIDPNYIVCDTSNPNYSNPAPKPPTAAPQTASPVLQPAPTHNPTALLTTASPTSAPTSPPTASSSPTATGVPTSSPTDTALLDAPTPAPTPIYTVEMAPFSIELGFVEASTEEEIDQYLSIEVIEAFIWKELIESGVTNLVDVILVLVDTPSTGRRSLKRTGRRNLTSKVFSFDVTLVFSSPPLFEKESVQTDVNQVLSKGGEITTVLSDDLGKDPADLFVGTIAVNGTAVYEESDSGLGNETPESQTQPPDSAPLGSYGDPHVKMWGGKTFDFHGGCDLVLLDNPSFHGGLGMTVHIRTKIVTWWSHISTAAIRIGNETLEVQGGNNHRYFVNGMEGDNSVDDFRFSPLGLKVHVKRITAKKLGVRIDLKNGDAVRLGLFSSFVRVNIKELDPKWKKFEGSVGLMGTYPDGEAFGRDGIAVFTDMNAFGQEWQVQESEPKLFRTVEGPQHPSKCPMPDKVTPEQKRRRLGESAIQKKDAELACAHALGSDFEHCVEDVLATNDIEIAGAY